MERFGNGMQKAKKMDLTGRHFRCFAASWRFIFRPHLCKL